MAARLLVATSIAIELAAGPAGAAEDPATPRFSISRAPVDTVATRVPDAVVIRAADRGASVPDSTPAERTGFPLATTILTAPRFGPEAGASLAHAVAGHGGARAVDANDPLARVALRGLGGNRVLLLDDGFPVYDLDLGPLDGPSFDTRMAERVTIVRGPQSLLYGAGALAGIVNVEFPEIWHSTEDGVKTRTAAEAYGVSGEHARGGAVRFDGAAGAIGWRVFGAGRRAGDLSTPDGDLGPLGLRSWNGDAALGCGGRDRRGELRVSRLGGRYDLPVSRAIAIRRELDDRRVRWNGEALVGDTRLRVRGQWQRHRLDATGAARPKLSMSLESYALDLSGSRQGDGWEGTTGVAGLSQTTETSSANRIVPDARVVSGGAFGFGRLRTGRLTWFGGGRFDERHIEAQGSTVLALATQSLRFDQWSLGIGASFRANQTWSAAASVGRAWRAPTLLELYAFGPSLDGERFALGGRDIGAEHGVGVDASVAMRSGRLSADLAAFAHDVTGLIDLDATGETRDGLPEFRYGGRRARLVGGEATVRFTAPRGVAVDFRADYVSGQNLTVDRPLPAIPPTAFALGAELDRARMHWASGARLRAELEGGARQSRLGWLDAPAAGYALVNLEAELRWERRDGTVRLGVAVTNLADARFRDFPSRDLAIAAGRGRSFMVRLSSEL